MKNTIYPSLKLTVIISLFSVCFLISGSLFSQKNAPLEKNSKKEKAERSPNYELYNLWRLDTLYSKYVSDRITPKWLSDTCFWYSYQTCNDVYWYSVNPYSGQKSLLTNLSAIKNQAKLKEIDSISQLNISIDNSLAYAHIELDTTYYTYNFTSVALF